VSFEHHESCITAVALNLGRLYLSEALEEIGELIVGESSWNVFDEEVCKVLSSVTSLVLLRVNKHLKLFVSDLVVVHLVDCFLGVLFGLELNVTEALRSSLFGGLDLAGYNLAKLLEHVVQTLLGDVSGHVFDQNIGVGVPVTVLLLVQHDLLPVEGGVVHLL